MKSPAVWLLATMLLGLLAARPSVGQQPASVSSATTSSSREAQLVQGWYRDYLGRSVGPELTAWVQLLRGGMSPIDVQATILGSDEFYQQKRRDPERFILDTLEGVTWQAPDQATVQRWTDRLNQFRGDRVALAREILLTYGQQQQQQQQPPAADKALELATQLASAARLLVDNAAFELAGTVQGQQVSLRARALADASAQLQQQLTARTATASQVNSLYSTVVGSFEAVQSALANPPGTAPSTSAVARRIGSIVVDVQKSLPAQASPVPTTPTNSYLAYDQRKLLTQVDSTTRAIQSVTQVLTPAANQDYRFSVALRDLNSLGAGTDAFGDAASRGASSQQLNYNLQTLRAQADRIRPQLFDGEPPMFTRLYWLSVEAGLEQMRDTLKAGNAAGGLAGGDSSLEPINVPVVTTRPDANLISLADQAIAQVDAFLTGISPLVYGVPDIPRVQRDVRTLRNRLLEFRQKAVEGDATSDLISTIRLAAGDYQTAGTGWDQVVNSYRLINPAQLAPVGASIDRIYQSLTNATASTANRIDPVPQTSQVQGLLAAFDQEMTGFETALNPFQKYPEFAALKVFINQMNGYSRSITELEKNPASNREQERRYTAGMQRLSDLFDAYTARIQERANAGSIPEPKQASVDLRQRVQRLAGLVNDLERQLH
jgi:hypothetical protein